MAGPSNPVVDVQLWQEAIELKFQYTVEAHQLNYPSAADAVAVGAMMIPSHHQDAIYFFPMAVIAWAWGPIKEPAPAEELKLMVYAMTDHSKVDAHPCTHWFGIDVRTLSPDEKDIHLQEVTQMRVRLQQYHDQHYGGSPMQKPSTPIQKETLMRVLSSLAFLQGYIAACVPSQGELGAEEQTNTLGRHFKPVELQQSEDIAKAYDHPYHHSEPYSQIVPGPESVSGELYYTPDAPDYHMGGGPNYDGLSGGSEASSAVSSGSPSPSPTGSNGERTEETRKTRRKGPDARLKAIYQPRINEMRENPNTRVVFQAKLTTQGLLEDFMKPKGLGAPPRSEKAAEDYLAAQSQDFKTSFEYYRAERQLYWYQTESKCTFHAWREAERGHSLGRKRMMLKAAAKKRGDDSVIPHPAGEDRKKPRVWV